MVEQPLVQDAELLLKQMMGLPKRVLAAVPLENRSYFIVAMDALIERADKVQAEEDLLALADAIHQLVEGIPKLHALLLPHGRNASPTHVPRQVTAKDHRETDGKSEYVQARTTQIKSSVIDLRNTLKDAIRQEPVHKEKS